MRIAALAILPLLAAIACGEKPIPAGDPVGQQFPRAEGASLEGETVRIPQDFAGEPVLLLLGYVQNAQFDADRWLLGLVEADLGLRFVEVPTIEGFVPGLLRGTIDSGMRGGIPREDWGSVVTVYGDRAAAIVRFTGNEEAQNVRVVLVDGEGIVRWFHDDGYSAGKLREMARVLGTLRRPAGEPPPIRTTVTRHYRVTALDQEPADDALERRVVDIFGRAGRKLREEARDPKGEMLHTFCFLYGGGERPTGMAAFYAEDGIVPSLEIFAHSTDGRRRSITYLEADGRITDRAEFDLDERGRSVERRYMRPDGTVYGVDTESYDERGDSRGWTFRRVAGEDAGRRIVHEFRYLAYDERGGWTRRMLVRDGRPASLQVREIEYAD